MTIQVKSELDFNDLMSQCWSGAVDTLSRIYDNNMEDDFMDLLNEIFETPTMTDINDYLWFAADYIYESLGISEDEDDNKRKFAVRTTGNRLTVLIDLDHNMVDLPIYTSLRKDTEAAREIYRNELRHHEAANSVSPEVYRAEKIGTLIPNDSCLRRL